MLLWQHAWFQSPASSKWNIAICDSTRQNTWSYLRRMPVPPSLKGPSQPVCFAGIELCGSHFHLYWNCSSQSPGFFWGFSAPVNSLWYGVLRRHYIVEFQYLFVFFFFYWIKFMPKKPWFCCGRAECRDLLRNVVGRQGIKKTRRFCCERALSISGTRGRSILVFREPPIANLQSFFYIVLPNGNLNKKVWEWLMVQRARRTQLQRTVSGLFCIEIRVSIAFPLFHLFAIVGDYS